MDVAQLGLQVDSSGVSKATADLNRLTNAAKVAENASRGLANASGRMDSSQIAAMARNMGGVQRASDAAARSLNTEALAAQRAASATKAHAAAVNDNYVRMNANVNRMGGSMSGLAAQFQDIGVTAAMGMNPMMIALQQGTQIAGQMEMAMQGGAKASAVFKQAILSLFSPVTFIAIALTALAAAGLQMVDWPRLAAAGLNGLASILQTIAPYAAAAAAGLALIYAPAIIGGIISVIALMGRLAVAAISAAAAMAAANPLGAFILGIAAAVAAANIFRDELTQIFGRDIVGDIKNAANFIINSFEAAFEDVKFLWNQFPNIMGAAAVGAANAAIRAMVGMIQKGIDLMDAFHAKINSVLPDGMQIPKVGKLDVGSMELANPYSAELDKALGDRNANLERIMGQDRVGQFGEAISRGASAASSKLKELARDITTVKDKSKKGGGKSDADHYQEIVDGANRRISSLKAEEAALGMTEQAALRLKYETDLLNQAQQKGITLTAAQKAELTGLAQTMASTELATKHAKESMDFAKDATKGFLSELRSGLQNGEGFWKSFGNAAMNVLNKIIDKIETQLVDALFSATSSTAGAGGGGFFSALFGGIGKIFGFASGGYTGNRAASAVAGVVHGGEYVFSKRATDRIGVGNLDSMHQSAKGYASGGYVAPAPANQNGAGGGALVVDVRAYVDDNGNWQAEVERVSQKQVQKAAPSIVNAAKQQAVPAMAEYQANTAGSEWR